MHACKHTHTPCSPCSNGHLCMYTSENTHTGPAVTRWGKKIEFFKMIAGTAKNDRDRHTHTHTSLYPLRRCRQTAIVEKPMEGMVCRRLSAQSLSRLSRLGRILQPQHFFPELPIQWPRREMKRSGWGGGAVEGGDYSGR